jgi:hypothetical protein
MDGVALYNNIRSVLKALVADSCHRKRIAPHCLGEPFHIPVGSSLFQVVVAWIFEDTSLFLFISGYLSGCRIRFSWACRYWKSRLGISRIFLLPLVKYQFAPHSEYITQLAPKAGLYMGQFSCHRNRWILNWSCLHRGSTVILNGHT